VKVRPGAAERLKELLTVPRFGDASRTPSTGAFRPIGDGALSYDVLGAQYTPKEIPREKRRLRGKKGTGKGGKRSSKKKD